MCGFYIMNKSELYRKKYEKYLQKMNLMVGGGVVKTIDATDGEIIYVDDKGNIFSETSVKKIINNPGLNPYDYFVTQEVLIPLGIVKIDKDKLNQFILDVITADIRHIHHENDVKIQNYIKNCKAFIQSDILQPIFHPPYKISDSSNEYIDQLYEKCSQKPWLKINELSGAIIDIIRQDRGLIDDGLYHGKFIQNLWENMRLEEENRENFIRDIYLRPMLDHIKKWDLIGISIVSMFKHKYCFWDNEKEVHLPSKIIKPNNTGRVVPAICGACFGIPDDQLIRLNQFYADQGINTSFISSIIKKSHITVYYFRIDTIIYALPHVTINSQRYGFIANPNSTEHQFKQCADKIKRVPDLANLRILLEREPRFPNCLVIPCPNRQDRRVPNIQQLCEIISNILFRFCELYFSECEKVGIKLIWHPTR